MVCLPYSFPLILPSATSRLCRRMPNLSLLPQDSPHICTMNIPSGFHPPDSAPNIHRRGRSVNRSSANQMKMTTDSV